MQLGEPGEDVVAAAGTCGAHERDTLGEQATRDESEELRGGMVEPLRVVDDAISGCCSATSANSVSVASPTRKRSGAGPALSPNTVASASRCGHGSRSSWSSIGTQS